jgi:hypothetical protein
MNTFCTMSRLLVVTAVIFASNATATVNLDEIAQSIGKMVSRPGVKEALGTAAGVAGGLMLKEQLSKENPLVIGAITGLTAGALGNSKAGVIAAGTSFAISTVRTFAPEIEIVDNVTDKLPKCLTSKEAKLVAQIAVATAVGHYLGTKN